MSRTPAAKLANLKVRFPCFTITKSLPGPGQPAYLAAGKGTEIRATTLTELETKLEES